MKPIESSFAIRPMQLSDIEQAMRLKNLEGWNQTEHDWKILLGLSPNTCLVAVRDKEVLGTITAINYSNELAWIGMMLVAEKFRRKGIGALLLRENLNNLKKCNHIKLDATPLGRKLYIKLGFEEEYTISRMILSSPQNHTITSNMTAISSISSQDIPGIAAMDKWAFGADRTNLFKSILEKYPGKSIKLKEKGRLAGYCFIRDGAKYTHLGPVTALTTEDAKTLLSAFMNNPTDRKVVIDVPFNQRKFLKWLTSKGFREQRNLNRMYYRNNYVPEQINKGYAICGPEFG